MTEKVHAQINGIALDAGKMSKADQKSHMGRRHSTPAQIGWGGWFRKYFWEGQSLSTNFAYTVENERLYSSQGSRFVARYRRPIGLLIPAFIVHFFWWSTVIKHNFFYLFTQKYVMTITMVFGSIFAGMTSEGGGAVAFPVMTLLLGVKPTTARDFSMLIQSVGMTAALFTILFMQVQIEWNAIIWGTFGGAIGLIIGLHYVDELKYPAWKKMGFVSLWFSFAFALFLLNRYHKRKTYRVIPALRLWKILLLILAGALGGAFTSFAGSGVDICMFSFLTLLFRVTEKTATPTSVVMMGIISVIGAFWRVVMIGNVDRDAFEYFAVCVPVVVFGAPIGSILGSHFHRQILAGFVYVLDTVALVTAFALVPQTPILAGASVGLIISGFIFFFILTKLGHCLMNRQGDLEGKEFEISFDFKPGELAVSEQNEKGKPGELAVSEQDEKGKEAEVTNKAMDNAAFVNEEETDGTHI